MRDRPVQNLILAVGVLTLLASGSSAVAQRIITPQKFTITSVEPKALTLMPGRDGKVAFTGTGLDLAQGVVVKRGRAVTQDIIGSLTCKSATACTLVLKASDKAAAGAYAVVFIDRNKQELGPLPLQLVVQARQLNVTSVKPDQLSLQPGESGKVEITGSNLDLAKAVLARFERTVAAEIGGKLTCRSPQACTLELAAAEKARPGSYLIVLIDDRKIELATLPLKLLIALPLDDTPQRTVTIAGEPGTTVQRSCDDTPLSTDMALLEPDAGAGLAVGTELVWTRTDHETCGVGGGTNKGYVLTICDNVSPNFPCSPTDGLYITVIIDPNYLGNGRCAIIPEDAAPEEGVCQIKLSEIAQRIGGISAGDTVYWQMRYRADASPNILGAHTEKRPLLFDLAEEPPPAPPARPTCPPSPTLFLPSNGSVIDSINKNFSWSDASPPNVPNDPNFPDWMWDVCLMKPPSETCVGDGPIRVIDNSLTGLSYYEFDEFGLIGGEMRWKVRACNEQNQCGNYSAPFTAYVPLAPAERIYPVHRADVGQTQTFAWRPVEGADIYRFRLGLSYEDQGDFQYRYLIREFTDATSTQLTAQDLAVLDRIGNNVPEEYLDRVSGWSVRTCYDPDDGGPIDPVCSDSLFAPFESFGGSFVTFTTNPVEPGEVSFDALLDTFRSPSCVNCHAVAATDFANGGDGTYGLPLDHPGVTATTNCTTCHTDALLPPGTHPIPWQPAPASMDFRAGPGILKSAAELCAMGQDPGSIASDVADHLAGDPLILWAVTGGPLPFNAGDGEQAFPGTLDEWKGLVQDWFDAGMPCEKPF